jgi:sulfane dehydrogenase subunit SoxC
MTGLEESVSPPARVADPAEGISLDELRLAARNHGMPLEALQYDITPVGLHYLLIHYDIPVLADRDWRLRIDGHVEHPLTLDLTDIRALPQVTREVTIECAGNGRALLNPRPVSQPWLYEAVGTARWTGTPLAPLLRKAGVGAGAVDVSFTGADHGIERGVEQDYERGLPLSVAMGEDLLLAHTMNGDPLPVQHGAPLRLVVPGWYGMAQVKWLARIRVLDVRFSGYQNATAYRIKQDADEDGQPVSRIRPRALMQPPGFPDFQTRARIVDRGVHELTGRAWSGFGPVAGVDVSVDNGATWHAATLGPARAAHAWRAWRWTWRAEQAGTYNLTVRASDAMGNVQPIDPVWNRQGMANNHAQRLRVTVR